MKNAIVLLFLLMNVTAAWAQFNIAEIGSYRYKIVLDPNDMDYHTWTELDLITWIFPDGQIVQQEIHLTNGMVSNHTDEIIWTPYMDPTMGTDQILAYVTKKGGTGTPPPISKTIPFTMIFGTTPPFSLAYATGKYWQVNKSWELSPNKETLFIFSFKPPSTCNNTNDEIRLHYPSQLIYLDKSDFEAGTITQSTGLIKISGFDNTPNVQKNIFFKVKTNASVGQEILVSAGGKFCSIYDTAVYSYTVRSGPHDPNKKTVDIDKVCFGQIAPVKLTYTVQFHNDGNAPVNQITVKDILPAQLDPTTFHLITPIPQMNGIDMVLDQNLGNEPTKSLTFTASTGMGLPGLTQTNPFSYSYDQTIYRYSFEVYTKQNNQENIDNTAEVTFFDNGIPIVPSIFTNVAQVEYKVSTPVDCYSGVTNLQVDFAAIKPNPFLDQIAISFELKEKSKISLEVHDIWGRLIESVASGEYTSGLQQFVWDGTVAPEGVYLIYLRTEKGSIGKKVVKIR